MRHFLHHHLFTAAAASSLCLCVGCVVLWTISYTWFPAVTLPDAMPVHYFYVAQGLAEVSKSDFHNTSGRPFEMDEYPSHWHGFAVGWFQFWTREVMSQRIWSLTVPMVYPTLFTGVLPLVWTIARYKRWRQRRRLASGCCLKCGYDLRASEGSCPECGEPIASKPAAP